jgi:peptide/nickel transport system substrate-binding protein
MAPNTLSSASPKTKAKAFAIVSTLLVVLVLVLAACGSSQSTTTTNQKHILTIGAQVGADFTKAFSPYNTSPDSGIQGMVYETLYFSSSVSRAVSSAHKMAF